MKMRLLQPFSGSTLNNADQTIPFHNLRLLNHGHLRMPKYSTIVLFVSLYVWPYSTVRCRLMEITDLDGKVKTVRTRSHRKATSKDHKSGLIITS